MTAVDFFCGGGGFSEGFRQAGIKVIAAYDIWQPAVDTHNGNHPGCNAIKMDVIKISKLSDEDFEATVPDSEIIIGSPPCTDFSNSNKSGKGDKSKGIELIEAYLRIIARKKYKKNSILKYWILENVPKVESHIKTEYKPSSLKLKGKWSLKVKNVNSGVYQMKYYGVPSNRKRYFCGDFPEPEKVFLRESEVIPLKKILKALGVPKTKLNKRITDPNYNFSTKGNKLTDHHYFHPLADFEWKKAKQLKQDKGYMGKMSIPENLDKPSRTIMATMSFSARESFILKYNTNGFRAPTIREVATLMSFPIDYQFYGSSVLSKYKLVGNAVPPKMSFALAKAILKKERRDVLNKYIKLKHSNKIELINITEDIPINTEKVKRLNSKYKYHIPYFIHKVFRVELTNHYSDFKNESYQWNTEIHYSQGKRMKVFTPDFNLIMLNDDDKNKADLFINSTLTKVVSHENLQKAYCNTSNYRKDNNIIGPDELLVIIKNHLVKEYRFHDPLNLINVDFINQSIPRPTLIGYYILSKILESIPKVKIENKKSNFKLVTS
ncbi:DNA cytosine methyltransferase [Sabulilitoribacter multivorans]|uniref:Cytosine-specific methyltransferase n=1 Tax=Flaviramulus multivorans TaxID=1304750 RepID=A0ABS9IJE7_9FLAO|nr:DNA cytosine methyltransferase [Flaviramulus multivorans]MCF7560715.1 DNA cytosine methyltransferase [Flaviramulus multivorans]